MRQSDQPSSPITPVHAPSPAAVATNRMCIALAALMGGLAVAKNLSPAEIAVRQWVLAAVFGACLACFVSVNFYRYRELDPSSDLLDWGALSRRLSRVVYLSLYLLFGVNGMAALLCNRLMEPTAENLGCFLAVGVIVLALIRVHALVWNHVSRHERALHRWLVPERA